MVTTMLKRPARPYSAAVLAACVLLLTACASNSHTKSLDDTLRQYEIVVRWSQWDGALDFLAPEYLATDPISQLDMDRLRLFRVTQYTVRSAIPFDESKGLQQVVEIRLFNRNRAVEQSLLDQQEWRYDDQRQRWFLYSGLPDVTRAR